MSYNGNKKFAAGAAVFGAILLVGRVVGQSPPEPPATPGIAGPLTPQQLDDLVAPIALYPDPLLGEVLAASTYPFEVAEAAQWVKDHTKWKPSKLMDEAKKQNWEPSIQGLVAFPKVLERLSEGTAWTTPLGNAFLAQPADVMQAVQRMRSQAQARGTLKSTSQQVVSTRNQGAHTAIEIEPANPDIWYVPDYNPVYVWGPPVYGVYPPRLDPGIGIGFGWGLGVDIGLYFGGWGGWGWGGWGWYPDWFGGGIILNGSFFHRYGFNHFHESGLGGSRWTHDPTHRMGVPYGNRDVASRFAAQSRTGRVGGQRPGVSSGQRLGSPGFEQRGYAGNHSVFGGYHEGGTTRMQSDHGFSSMGAGRIGGGGFGGGGFGGRGGGGGRR